MMDRNKMKKVVESRLDTNIRNIFIKNCELYGIAQFSLRNKFDFEGLLMDLKGETLIQYVWPRIEEIKKKKKFVFDLEYNISNFREQFKKGFKSFYESIEHVPLLCCIYRKYNLGENATVQLIPAEADGISYEDYDEWERFLKKVFKKKVVKIFYCDFRLYYVLFFLFIFGQEKYIDYCFDSYEEKEEFRRLKDSFSVYKDNYSQVNSSMDEVVSFCVSAYSKLPNSHLECIFEFLQHFNAYKERQFKKFRDVVEMYKPLYYKYMKDENCGSLWIKYFNESAGCKSWINEYYEYNQKSNRRYPSMKKRLRIVMRRFTDSSDSGSSYRLPKIIEDKEHIPVMTFIYALCVESNVLFNIDTIKYSPELYDNGISFNNKIIKALNLLFDPKILVGYRRDWYIASFFLLKSVLDVLPYIKEYESDFYLWKDKLNEKVKTINGIHLIEKMRREIVKSIDNSIKDYKDYIEENDVNQILVEIYADNLARNK